MMRKSVMVAAVSAALTVAVFAASNTTRKSTVSVGDFAVKVSNAIGRPASSPAGAVQSLRSFGVKIEDVNASLTEGTAARILGDLGIRVTTANPNSNVSIGKAEQLAAIVGLSSVTSITPGATLPTQCLQESNRGQCDTCCTDYLTANGQSTQGGVCAKFCKSVPPPGQQSPSDPNP